MPTTLTPREIYLKFVKSLAEGKWGEAQDCVASNFRGTISALPQDRELNFADYIEEMKRLRAAYKHFGRTRGTSHFFEKDGVLTVSYELDMVFAHALRPRRGDRVSKPQPANNKPIQIKTTDTVTFSAAGEILMLTSVSDAQNTWEQMTA